MNFNLPYPGGEHLIEEPQENGGNDRSAADFLIERVELGGRREAQEWLTRLPGYMGYSDMPHEV